MENDKPLWDQYERVKHYYNNAPLSDLFNCNDEEAAQRCKRFIYGYFRDGHKPQVFDIPFRATYEESGKHLHTVSLYFFGCALSDTFRSVIFEGVKKALNSDIEWYNEENDYSYSWFLTCLYHDIASCIETKIPYNASESFKHLEFYLGKSNVRYTPFNHQPINQGAALNCYSEELIKNYFYYRSNKGETDHGILGGYLLFDRLQKIFIEKIQGKKTGMKEFYTEGPNGQVLRWNIEFPDHFAYVADAIICHNLWTKNKGDNTEEYEQYGLDPLIIKDDSDKVSIKRFPLQFMLRLLDTIEPTKRFRDIPAETVLKNIYTSNDKNKILIGWTPMLESHDNFKGWLNPIKYLDKWMDVRVIEKKSHDGYPQVLIKFN